MAKRDLKLEKMVADWVEADRELANWKTREANLRKELAEHLFPKPKEGADNKARVGFGKAIQLTHKINRSIDKTILAQLREKSNIAPLIDKIVKFTPELRVKEFKELSADDIKLVADMITEKPGLPTIELKDENKIRW